jgi:prefoldin subunit 5
MIMPLTVSGLADEVRDTNRRLTAAIDGLRNELADLRVQVAEINTNLKWARGIGRIIAGSAVAIAVLVGTGIYRFGHVENPIAELQRDTAELRKDTAEHRAELRKDIAEIKADLKARDDRLSQTLQRMEKALPASPEGNL